MKNQAKKRKCLRGGVGAVTFALLMSIQSVSAYAETPVVLPEGGVVWEEGKTVFYKDESSKPEGDKDYTGQYAKMTDALTAVYMSEPEGTAVLYCKPKADVGPMTHGHVGDSLTVYGNDAYVSGGEHDFEIDTYGYDRKTGKQAAGVPALTEDVTLTVKGLDGAAAWGQRTTNHKVDLVFEDCQFMNRVYFSGTKGEINLMVNSSSFDVARYAHQDTSIYTNAPGKIEIVNTSFSGISVPINLNNKLAGSSRDAIVSRCTFTDCSNKATAGGAAAYAAPVRVVGVATSNTNLSLDSLKFFYSDGVEQCGNGDILLGEGRNGIAQQVVTGTVKLNMKNLTV